MKQVVKFSLSLLIAGLLGGAVFSMKQTLSAKSEQAARIQQRPDLSRFGFLRNSGPATSSSKPTLIILFNPDCEHCQYEAEQLQKRHREFAHASVCLLTTETPARAQAFARQYGLDTLAMMHVGTLPREESYRTFGPTSVPHIFIYGADGNLRKEFKGETKIDALLPHLK